MPTSSFTFYQKCYEDFANKIHDFFGTTDTLKVALTNTAPNAATHGVLADITEIGAGNGYTAGGEDTQNDGTRSGATVSVVGTDITWTAAGGTVGPFRYAVLYNDTPAGDPLIGYWDYGSAITLQIGDTFKTDFGATMFTIT